MPKLKIYFPNLNGLRFIAAFMVIIHHAELSKAAFNVKNMSHIPFFSIIGPLGVVLFFVLSGFLITYLLLVEEKSTGDINIKQFYIRRILKIWPLYFIIIGLAIFVLPNIHTLINPGFDRSTTYDSIGVKIMLFVLFLPNLLLSIYYIFPFAAHTWSIGTEEQFYLGWPILMKKFKKNRIRLMLFVIALYLIIKYFFSLHYSDFIPYKSIIDSFWSLFKIDCMAIGGFFALLLYNKSYYLKFFMNKYVFNIILFGIIILLIKGVSIPYIHCEFYAILFGIIILNFAANKNIWISLENKPLNYMGKISYGLYMYHPLLMAISLKSLFYFKIYNIYTMWLFSVFLTIIVASLSYHFIEFRFIKLKSRFSSILSGDNVNKNDNAKA